MSYPSALELHRQAAWEMEGVRRATERYREAAKSADPATLPTGKRLLRVAVEPLISLIEAAQKEAAEQLTAPGRQGLWCWPIQLLPAEQLAVLTVSASFRSGLATRATGYCLVSQAEDLARIVRDQLEYERWTAEQEQANREAKRRRDEDHQDLLGRLHRRYPNLDRRVWAKWRSKLELLRAEPWGKVVDVAVGTKLFQLLVEAAPRYFMLESLPLRGGDTQLRLVLTPEALEEMRDIEARAEVARPMLMPMIIPPNPWTYPEAA